MAYVPLDRDFYTLDPGRSYSAELIAAFRGFTWRGLKWPDLLKKRRTVILAEAAMGKTEELRHHARLLREQGSLAIYLPIERLAAAGLGGSLGRDEKELLDSWLRGGDPGWFFLDSIDEARVNRADVERALNSFAVELAEGYDRAHVVLSCRGTVWEGDDDLALVGRTLPLRDRPAGELEAELDPDDALLRKPERKAGPRGADEPDNEKVVLVALAKLSDAQRAAFLAAQGITDISRFNDALYNRGLEPLAERPGDLKTLSRYWQTHSDLGDLTEMVEFGVKERLEEPNENRRRSIAISPRQAREGAERLAAALTLGRSMDLLIPEVATAGARGVSPFEVLDDWNRNDVEGLLHRGIFVPSGTGTIRFFHRSAQEYLTASWFLRLGLSDSELGRIFLADSFGVRTLPPSLRAAAGWIAGQHLGLRARILEREPQLLLAEGDPRKLSVEERSVLLLNFARRELAGDNSYRFFDYRALWMFADQRLVPAIREALKINDRADFRFEMLRLIKQGKLGGCEDILAETAIDSLADDYHRIVALQAMADLEARKALSTIAKAIMSGPAPSATFGPAAAVALFPAALSVEQLLELIGRTKPARRFQVEGFRGELLELYEQCRTPGDKRKLLDGLARLAFEPPLGDWPKISTRNATLVAMFGPTARRAVRDAAQARRISPELLSFLRATQRVSEDADEPVEPVEQLVRSWPKLNEALFWADAEAPGREDDKPATRFHDVSPDGPSLWGLSAENRPWLMKAIRSDTPHRRLVAIDALIILAFSSENTIEALQKLRQEVAGDGPVEARVVEALTPRQPTEQDLDRERRWAAIKERQVASEEGQNNQWRKIRARVQAAPEKLKDERLLRRWPGPLPLLQLTEWLSLRASGGLSAGALQSPLLNQAFGSEVADAYREGMKFLWRVTKPERPAEKPEGQRTFKRSVVLSFAGIGLEAAADPRWVSALDASEAQRAIDHAMLDDQGAPRWLSDLLADRPDIAGPPIAKAVKREWRSGSNYTPFLSLSAHSLTPLAALKEVIVKLIAGPEPAMVERISTARDLALRLDLSAEEKARLARITLKRLRKARAKQDRERAAAQLRLLFSLQVGLAAQELMHMVEASLAGGDLKDIEQLFRTSFHRHRDPAVDAALLSARQLQRLLEIAYQLRSKGSSEPAPEDEDDEDDEDARTRDAFDDPRNELLSALLRSDDPEAYPAMLELARNPVVGASQHRLLELAREIAENAAERPTWAAKDLRPFEERKLAPVATGSDLLNLTCDLIDQIQWDFDNADMSPRSVVVLATEEKEVQEWLGWALPVMANERITAVRETVVAEEKRPDLTFAAANAPVEVAVEIKHGGKSWSHARLSNALRKQLAGQYLRPAKRRHGVLVVSHHRNKRWRDARTKAPITFAELMARLKEEAEIINDAAAGMIRVEVRGLDATRHSKATNGKE